MPKARAPSARLSEERLVALFRQLFAQPSSAVELGIGDDAAVLKIGGKRLVWTIDTSVEGRHFERAWLDFADVGYRAMQAAISDLAAMGAKPIAALSNLAVPRDLGKRDLQRLARGQAQAAREQRCPLVGGNLSQAPALSVTISVVGEAKKPLLRSGGRAGDELWLVGSVGLARAGLLLLQCGLRAQERALATCVSAWRRPRARVREGLGLVGRAHAAIDVSDGLRRDLRHLATASGLKAVLDERALAAGLSPTLHAAARALGEPALELALTGGEDYALLASGPRGKRPRGALVIGWLERGAGAVLLSSGRQRPLSGGFDHFAGRERRS